MNADYDISKWIKLADMDFATARHMFETYRPILIEVVCFHSQQTAEKMLKCYLISQEVEAPKIHDTRKLCDMCIEVEPSFNDIYKEAAFLNKFSVLPRYPSELELIEHDGETAVNYAEKVMNFVKGRVEK